MFRKIKRKATPLNVHTYIHTYIHTYVQENKKKGNAPKRIAKIETSVAELEAKVCVYTCRACMCVCIYASVYVYVCVCS